MRLIDADGIKDSIKWNRTDADDLIKYYIDSAPTVDAVPVVHAKWNLADDGDGIVCSNCGEDFCTIVYEEERMLYCPHCGAKMDLEDDKNE